ncbi:MAG: cupin domain-containing protein [Rhodospirillales bacterium]|nr:cupin domain-containing protein [Rhodospirillales bacterium]
MKKQKLTLPALDPLSVQAQTGSAYPNKFKAICEAREKAKIGDVLGLTNFGVNLTRLRPGTASSQRHWHDNQDEFIYVIEGELVLVTDAGEQILTAGAVAGFPAGKADGHQLINKSDHDALYLEVGDRTPGGGAEYPDIDMRVKMTADGPRFTRKDGTPYGPDE